MGRPNAPSIGRNSRVLLLDGLEGSVLGNRVRRVLDGLLDRTLRLGVSVRFCLRFRRARFYAVIRTDFHEIAISAGSRWFGRWSS
jgi:hypothetical protein